MRQPTSYYNLETKLNKNNEQLIFFNLRYRYYKYIGSSAEPTYQGMRISTGWRIRREDWNGKNRATDAYVRRKGKDLNNALQNIETVSEHQLNLFFNEHGVVPTPTQLKELVREKLGRIPKTNTDISLIEFIDKMAYDRHKLPKTQSDHISVDTKKQYGNLTRHLTQYEQKTGKKLTLETFSEDEYWDFFKVVNNIYKAEKDEYLTQTTVAKDCKNLKSALKYAKEKDHYVNLDYSKKYLKIHEVPKGYETYLTKEELEKIIKSDVTHSKMFEHARNYIILAAFTGLRIGDMIYLHEINPETKTRNKKNYRLFYTKIRKSQENKEALYVSIPILKPVQDLLNANGGKFPAFPSQQNIREYIKKYLKHLELNEEVIVKTTYYLVPNPKIERKEKHQIFGPHDARASFITNLKQLGIHNDTLEKITHPTINYKSILDHYDKSDMVDYVIKFVNELKTKKDKIYKYE